MPLIGQVLLVMLNTNVVDSLERYLNNFGQSWIILNIHRYQPHKKREELSRREHFIKRDSKQSSVCLCSVNVIQITYHNRLYGLQYDEVIT